MSPSGGCGQRIGGRGRPTPEQTFARQVHAGLGLTVVVVSFVVLPVGRVVPPLTGRILGARIDGATPSAGTSVMSDCSAATRRLEEGLTMGGNDESVTAADAFVFFGATGDLAHKMIFPALYRMVKRGRLNVP